MDQRGIRLAAAVLFALSATAAQSVELADPSRIPDLPDITATLAGKPIDSVTATLGAPQSANVIGSFQFVEYRSLNCLSQPCYFVATCHLTLTVETSTSKIASAKIDGFVTGPEERSRNIFIPYIAKLCNADFSKRLSALAAQ